MRWEEEIHAILQETGLPNEDLPALVRAGGLPALYEQVHRYGCGAEQLVALQRAVHQTLQEPTVPAETERTLLHLLVDVFDAVHGLHRRLGEEFAAACSAFDAEEYASPQLLSTLSYGWTHRLGELLQDLEIVPPAIRPRTDALWESILKALEPHLSDIEMAQICVSVQELNAVCREDPLLSGRAAYAVTLLLRMMSRRFVDGVSALLWESVTAGWPLPGA